MKRFCYRIAPALLAIFILCGCTTRIPRRRTLPEWVTKIYVPMFKNDTAEPSIEAYATEYTVEEFLADGRLEVVQRHDADLVLRATIVDYIENASGTSNDKFTDRMGITAVARIELYDPSETEEPMAKLGQVSGSASYTSDMRSAFAVLDMDAKRVMARSLARVVVQRVLTGFSPAGRGETDENDVMESLEYRNNASDNEIEIISGENTR